MGINGKRANLASRVAAKMADIAATRRDATLEKKRFDGTSQPFSKLRELTNKANNYPALPNPNSMIAEPTTNPLRVHADQNTILSRRAAHTREHALPYRE
jgi:hypothetical protein